MAASTRPMTALSALVEIIATRLGATRPLLVGIAGPVAVGKTTIVSELADALPRRGHAVAVLSTDAFLLANDVLTARGLAMRKGFPESYDRVAMAAALATLRSGAAVQIPVYSHDVYDVVPGARQSVAPADVVLLEGVVALQAPVADVLDLAIYVDAPEASVRQWFFERFARLTAAAAGEPSSFYHRFAALPAEQVRELAVATWDGINAPNLREHIAPSAARADVVVHKAADHAIAAVRLRAAAPTAV